MGAELEPLKPNDSDPTPVFLNRAVRLPPWSEVIVDGESAAPILGTVNIIIESHPEAVRDHRLYTASGDKKNLANGISCLPSYLSNDSIPVPRSYPIACSSVCSTTLNVNAAISQQSLRASPPVQ